MPTALVIDERQWEKLKVRDRIDKAFICPYCNVRVRATSDARISDGQTGLILYHIFKCPQCHMPVTISREGIVIPPTQFLPFEDIHFLPNQIGKMYKECRKAFQCECYYSVVMVARSLLMHIAADKGAESGLKFVQYIDFLVTQGYIAPQGRPWVEKIRALGNQFIHELDEATQNEAEKAIVFISQLLKNVYELPQMAMEV